MDGDGPLQPVTLGRNKSQKLQTHGWIPKNKWAKFALMISILQFVVAASIEMIITIQSRSFIEGFPFSATDIDKRAKGQGQAITAYHAMFLAAQLFQLVLIADSLMQLSLVQLVATTIFNWAMWGYSIIQTLQSSSWLNSDLFQKTTFYNNPKFAPIPTSFPTQPIEHALIGILLCFCLGWIFLTWKLYYVFGWTTYKEMGADVEVRNVLYLYHIYILLLKFDVYFFLGFSFQFATLVIGIFSDTIIHLAISIPGTVFLLALAYYAVRKENKMLVYATLAAFLVGIGYLVSKLWAIYVQGDSRFESSKNSLTLFSNLNTNVVVLTILMCIATITVALLNMMNFGQGLMLKLDSTSQETIGERNGEVYGLDAFGEHA